MSEKSPAFEWAERFKAEQKARWEETKEAIEDLKAHRREMAKMSSVIIEQQNELEQLRAEIDKAVALLREAKRVGSVGTASEWCLLCDRIDAAIAGEKK